MSTRDTLIRAAMAGATLALAAAFAVMITVQTGEPLAGAVLFPVGFVLLYLLGFDLLTGIGFEPILYSRFQHPGANPIVGSARLGDVRLQSVDAPFAEQAARAAGVLLRERFEAGGERATVEVDAHRSRV